MKEDRKHEMQGMNEKTAETLNEKKYLTYGFKNKYYK